MSETIPGLLRAAAARFGTRPALVSPTEPPLSFRQLDIMVDRFAKGLIHSGMAHGDRVGIWAPNSYEWVAAATGAQRAGGVMIPLYFRYRVAEVAEILRRARIAWLVCSGELAEALRAEHLTELKSIVVVRQEYTGLRAGEIAWDEFLLSGNSVAEETLKEREGRVTPDTISDIMFTSGTTGRPKGAVFTHRSGVAAGRIMEHFNGATESDCFCPMGTFAHVGGYKQGWITGLCSGASIAWGDAFDAASVFDLVSRLGITIMPAAPITWQGVLDFPERGERDISCLRFASTGGTMIPPELVRRLITDLKVAQVGTGYGMTETCGMVAYTRPDDPVEKVTGTVGRPAPDTEIRIVSPTGEEVPTGETGEILIRNPRLLTGYLDDEIATDRALDNEGWFRSGDVGSFDDAGYLRITDRLKDMYIINGLNVYPAEIEKSIENMSGVQQCAVVGIPEPIKGEVGVAFVVRAPGHSVDEEAIRRWCRDKLAGYKAPKYIRFVDNLPRNVMGKVLKTELRKLDTEN